MVMSTKGETFLGRMWLKLSLWQYPRIYNMILFVFMIKFRD